MNPAEAAKRLKISGRASAHLDLCRGVAALAVMVSHLRALFFLDYSDVQHKNAGVAAIYAVTGLGHQAVVIFFVLSGLLIAKSVLYPVRDGSWSWKTYLINRCTRLYVVLVPALLLCAFWDWRGMALPGAHTYYWEAVANLGSWNVIDRFTLAGFTGNLLFLQSIFCDPFGSNSPLWSLSYEFWYYMLFPLLILFLSKGVSRPVRIAYFTLAVAILVLIGPVITVYFLMWLAGAALTFPLLSRWRMPRERFGLAGLIGLAVFAAALAISRLDLLSRFGDLHFFLVAASFVPVLLVIVSTKGEPGSKIYARVASLLAGFSYTLYLTHMPLLFFFRTSLASLPRWQPDGLHLLYGSSIALVVLAYSYAIYWLTESRTGWVRASLTKRFSTPTASPEFATYPSDVGGAA
jgi:peptidoglycan/LPS O-acetylase OafA/YrhL